MGREISELRSAVGDLQARQALAGPSPTATGSAALDQLRAQVADQLRHTLSAELGPRMLREIEEKYSTQVRGSASLDELRRRLEGSKARLSAELESLTNRGNLNLVIGVITTLGAIGVLFWMVSGFATATGGAGPAGTIDWQRHLMTFIPRLSVAVFIEVFAFFFLRLYKGTMAEAQLYHRQLNDLAFASAGVELALMSEDRQALAKAAEHLMPNEAAPASGAAAKVAKSVDATELVKAVTELVQKALPK